MYTHTLTHIHTVQSHIFHSATKILLSTCYNLHVEIQKLHKSKQYENNIVN